MTAAGGTPGRAEPVERFRPTSGRAVGWLSLAVIAGVLGYVSLEARTVTGLRLMAGGVFLAVLVWVTQLRPRAALYVDRLHLRNSLLDVSLPLHLVDRVTVRRVLNVWAGGRRYVCIGIGAPLRTLVKVKPHGPASLLGWDRLEAYTEESTPPRPDQTATSYTDFVEARITGLVVEARSRRAGPPGAVCTTWAWREVAALALTATGFAATLLL